MGHLWGQDEDSGYRNREALLFLPYPCWGLCGFEPCQVRYLHSSTLWARPWLVAWVTVVSMATSLRPTLAILALYTVWMSTASRLCSTCSISARCTGRPDSWTQCSWIRTTVCGGVTREHLPGL